MEMNFVEIVIFLGAAANHIVPNFAVSTDITLLNYLEHVFS